MKGFHSFKTGLVIASAAIVLTGCATSGHRYSEANDGYPSDAPNLSNVPDAVPRNEPHASMGNAPTYEVLGKVYHVLPSSEGYDRVGIASFYGTKFNGYHTSDGEIYNMYAMTAASKVLPLPTYVKVTNLENGRSVIVRVNDRGPFNSRIMDLSYAAATKLGYVRQGTARVRVQAINPATWHASSESSGQTALASSSPAHSTETTVAGNGTNSAISSSGSSGDIPAVISSEHGAVSSSTGSSSAVSSSAGSSGFSSGEQASDEHLTSDSAGQLMASTAGASPHPRSENDHATAGAVSNVEQGTAADTSNGTSADLSSSTASQLMSSSASQTAPSTVNNDDASAAAGVYLQAIAVTDETQAEQIRQRLSQAMGVAGRIVPFHQYFRVQMGPFSESGVSQARAELAAQGYPGAILIR
ncbi:Endolytic peptidoglycan transglycosylase RlpA [Halomonadaceae bacterium LMG 33818]|uniref:septal ring lytic transglycosylase RlpA family protein n=1 Tax=Cernens ardua TaxID=3402176 RepID=UPI003EDC5DBB